MAFQTSSESSEASPRSQISTPSQASPVSDLDRHLHLPPNAGVQAVAKATQLLRSGAHVPLAAALQQGSASALAVMTQLLSVREGLLLGGCRHPARGAGGCVWTCLTPSTTARQAIFSASPS